MAAVQPAVAFTLAVLLLVEAYGLSVKKVQLLAKLILTDFRIFYPKNLNF